MSGDMLKWRYSSTLS